MTTPLTPERWQRIDAILQSALGADSARRAEIVAAACGDDTLLRDEVLSLLAAHDGATTGFLERTPALALGDPSARLTERLQRALDGRYTIEAEVAHGGMATVFRARDLRHDRTVAIKVLREEVAAAIGAERFLEEIRVTASLQHAHILPLFDSGTADGLPWYAMPFIDGETLRARLARGPLPVADAVRLAREIANALDYAHARGVVHRDVKPENVLLQDSHALVADFGIALALEQAGGERLTRTGVALGTPQYMAPEQANGERTVDARADVYALGAVVHEMLIGEAPFAGTSRQAVVMRLMHESPAPLVARRPEIALHVDLAVRRALAKQPYDRFETAGEFARALVPAKPSPIGVHLEPNPRGRTVSARAAIYTAIVMLVVGLAGGLVASRRMADPAPIAAPDIAPNIGPSDAPLVIVDRSGRVITGIPAERPWTPRFSPDGKRVAYGAFGAGRSSSDLFVTDLAAGTTQRITDDDADSNDPQWSSDGRTLVYSAAAPNGKNIERRLSTGSEAQVVAARDGTQFPSDFLRDGSALLVTDDAGGRRQDIIIQPTDRSAARPYMATDANEAAARISPDNKWVAYTSDASGRDEIYLGAYPQAGTPTRISTEGGIHPVWRGDGRELYYWRDGALIAVTITPGWSGAPSRGPERILFRAAYQGGFNQMYDVSPDGSRFVIVRNR